MRRGVGGEEGGINLKLLEISEYPPRPRSADRPVQAQAARDF